MFDYTSIKDTGRPAGLITNKNRIPGTYYAADIDEDSLPFGLQMFYLTKGPDANTFNFATKDRPDAPAGVFVAENGHAYDYLIFKKDRTVELDGNTCRFEFM
jgi:hypothetical protein